MESWFNRNAAIPWLLFAIVDFSVAGFHLYTGTDVLPSTTADAAMFGGLGLVSLCVACFYHLKAQHAQ
jgi:hypothetical protein